MPLKETIKFKESTIGRSQLHKFRRHQDFMDSSGSFGIHQLTDMSLHQCLSLLNMFLVNINLVYMIYIINN
jgi:hypothetical protein